MLFPAKWTFGVPFEFPDGSDSNFPCHFPENPAYKNTTWFESFKSFIIWVLSSHLKSLLDYFYLVPYVPFDTEHFLGYLS